MRACLSLLLLLFGFGALPATAQVTPSPDVSVAPQAPRPLVIHFFDVGQGDAALLLTPSGKSILIDGGPPEAGPALAARVDALVDGPLDLVVLSHPHLDHLGGLGAVLARVGARRFLEPEFDHPTQALAELREQVNALQIRRQLPRFPTLEEEERQAPQGARARFEAHRNQLLEVGLGGGAVMELHWPKRHAEPFLEHTRSDANANSIVARVRYGQTAVLFTGDAEEDTERKLVRAGHSLKAQVLKVAHHGSRHSSTWAFLKAVRPELAIISAGQNNDYGHPHPEAVARLEKVGARVLSTATAGEVVVQSDGEKVTLLRSSPQPAASVRTDAAFAEGYVASRRSEVFHKADCENARKIQPHNRLTFSTRESAAQGRHPAKDCQP